MRIILYTGKGGTGKTSAAAATALKIALSGKKVLIMSTDQAHSLSDSFGIKLSNQEKKISEFLYGMEIDPIEESGRLYGKLKEYLNLLLTSKSEKGIEAEELLVFPGMEELCSLVRIKEIYDKGDYDVLIVDCAPTGETLSLLKFPEMLEGFMTRFFPKKRKAVNLVGGLVEKMTKIPIPKEEHFSEFEMLYEKLNQLRTLMEDKHIVSIRIVTTPEKIVIKETKRNFTFMHLFQYNVDAIVVNKIYPEESLKGYFDHWIGSQENGLKEIEESFPEVPVLKLYLMKQELRMEEALKKAADELFCGIDPTEVLFQNQIFELMKENEGYTLRLYLPHAEKSEMDMLHKGEELLLIIKNERRSLMLPEKIKGKEIKGAKFENGKLDIHFV